MATQVQFRGGTTSEHSTFTGVAREVTVDTTKKTVVVHDGSTAGGIPLAKESAVTSAAAITGGSINGTTVGASTASTGAFTTLSASSTVSGAGFSTYLASPPAIGGTTASTGRFTTVTATGLTSGRVTFAGASGLLSDSANLTWDNSNARLGVGTASPAVTLHASASVTNSGGIGTEILRVANTRANTGTSGASISFVTNEIESTNQYIRGQITGEYDGSSNVNGRLLFATANTSGTLAERMRITSAGNVGIGTSSPNAKLQVTSSSFPVLKVADAIGGGALALGDEGTNNNYVGIWRGAANSTSGGGFLNVQGNGIAFMSSDNVFGSASERMRIDSSGNVSVNNSAGTKYVQLQPDGSIRSVHSNGGGGDSVFSAITGISNGYQIIVTAGNAQTYKWHNGGTQSMTLDSSGNLLVGTTTQASSVSNIKNIVGGRVNSFSGSLSSLNSGTAYTMFTMTADFATYIVTCSGLVSSAAYSETAIVHLNNTSVTVTIIADGGLCTISNSGLNIQYTQNSGAVMADMAWSVIRIL